MLQWVGPVVAKESASSGGGREHTHDQEASTRYEHQHPPTQLASPIMLGEEEAPLVADDVAAVEEAMHDAMNEDNDPLRYLNRRL